MNTVVDGVDYGPLAQLIGKWVGDRGLDKAPDANADPDETTFTDEMLFSPSGPAENAEEQQLVSVKYHHIVRKQANGAIFHDQIGHWIYEKATNTLMHSLTIPRGVCVLAGGEYQEDNGVSIFHVAAKADSNTYGIVQSPFMLEKARTKAFEMCMTVAGDTLSYIETTYLHIYGKDFDHVDQSQLSRVLYDVD